MNEWQLQQRLQHEWASGGPVLHGERLLLVAREIMTDWDTNDAAVRWNLPPVDFVLLDAQGRLVVLELKMRIRSRRESALALCQVTHMASEFCGAFSLDLLNMAYRRDLDKGAGAEAAKSLKQAHTAFFDLSQPVTFTPNGARRVVAATAFSEAWASEVANFTADDVATLKLKLASKYALDANGNRAIRRFRDEVFDPLNCAPRVESLLIA